MSENIKNAAAESAQNAAGAAEAHGTNQAGQFRG